MKIVLDFHVDKHSIQSSLYYKVKLGGGGAIKKIVPSGGRREHFWGISCEKSRFYTKKSYFFQF